MKTQFNFQYNVVSRMVLFITMTTLAFSCQEGENELGTPSQDRLRDISQLTPDLSFKGVKTQPATPGASLIDPATPKDAVPFMIENVNDPTGSREDAPPNPQNWRTYASDEFNTPGVLSGMWSPNYPHNLPGSPNQHLHNHEAYMDHTRLSIHSGVLQLTATKGRHPAAPPSFVQGGKVIPVRFTSGAVNSQGRLNITQADLRRGMYIEAGIAIADTKGAWSAFWAMPGSGWPPELDILEAPIHLDQAKFPIYNSHRRYFVNFHFKKPGGGKGAMGGYHWVGHHLGFSFNVYGVRWVDRRIDYYINGQKIRTTNLTPFQRDQMQNMYLILNLAVGGWPGNMTEQNQNTPPVSVFPSYMYVDFVRLYTRR